MNRRDFIQSLTIFGTGVTLTSVIKPLQAEADIIAPLLTLSGYAGPILALATLIESAWNIGMNMKGATENTTKLNAIASDISRIADNQESILRQLADMRIVMREEIRRGFLDHDARELYATSRQFKDALSDNDQKGLRTISMQADHLAFAISKYGLAALPAYLSAIALQNGIHFAMKSSPTRFISFNDEHGKNLRNMLYGSGSDSLQAFITLTAPLPPSYQFTQGNLETLRNQIGRKFLFAIISRVYEAAPHEFLTPASNQEVGVIYKGFYDGEPIFDVYQGPEIPGHFQNYSAAYSDKIQGKKVISIRIWFDAVKVMAGDYRDIPGLLPKGESIFASLQPKFIDLDSNGRIVNKDILQTVRLQQDAVRNYYMQFYDLKMGREITQTSSNPQPVVPPSKASQDMRAALAYGLNSVDRIIAAAATPEQHRPHRAANITRAKQGGR